MQLKIIHKKETETKKDKDCESGGQTAALSKEGEAQWSSSQQVYFLRVSHFSMDVALV